MISARTASLLYVLLLVFAWATLKGKFLSLAVIIVLALAMKTWVDYLKRKL